MCKHKVVMAHKLKNTGLEENTEKPINKELHRTVENDKPKEKQYKHAGRAPSCCQRAFPVAEMTNN